VTKKLGEVKAAAISTVDIKISDTNKRNLRLAANTILGIPEGVDFNTYQNAIETELRLSAIVDRINKTTGFGDILTPKDTEDPLLTNVLDILSEGNAGNNFKSRVEMLRRIDSAIDKTTDSKTGKSTLSGDDVEALVFLTGIDSSKGNQGAKTKLIENLWLSRELKSGHKTNKNGKPLSAIDMTEEDIKIISEDIDTKIQGLAIKLGATSSEEVETVMTNSIGPAQIQLMNEVITETEELLEPKKQINIEIDNLPLEGTIPSSITGREKETVESVITEPIETKPTVIAEPTNVSELTKGILDSLDNIEEDTDLTADEIADLTNRVCYRKDNP